MAGLKKELSFKIDASRLPRSAFRIFFFLTWYLSHLPSSTYLGRRIRVESTSVAAPSLPSTYLGTIVQCTFLLRDSSWTAAALQA